LPRRSRVRTLTARPRASLLSMATRYLMKCGRLL
jgi:hypothetical protein